MFKTSLKSIKQYGTMVLRRRQAWLKATTKPVRPYLALGTAQDLMRSKTELVIENALLRQQLIVLNRRVKRPHLTRTDRWLMVLLSSKLQHWTQALLIIQPETVLRWHRDLFKWLWRRKSPHKGGQAALAAEVVALICQMGVENRLWGVKRIYGELLKLGFRVSKRTIRKYMRRARPQQPQGQTWLTFLHNQAEAIWACDFIQITDEFLRSLF